MKIKKMSLVRGVYFCFQRLNSYFWGKHKFASCGKSSTLTPPWFVYDYSKIYKGEDVGIGPNAFISAVGKKFIVKNHCVIAEGLTVHTGNHARLVGEYVSQVGLGGG